MRPVSRNIDRFDVTFDDDHLVANAGLILVATLAARLGLEGLVNDTVRLIGRVGGALPGRKVLTLVHAIIAGGSHIDHADVLRSGATAGVLGHRVMAPSTLGTFLRAFTWGHVRQLDKVIGETVRRAWAMGAGPGEVPLVIDVDSTITEVHGHAKAGAAYGYTHQLGYHPLIAVRAEGGEVLHARMRKGSSQRGTSQFLRELIARVRRNGATGALTIRFDSGFWSAETIELLVRRDVRYTMGVRTGTPAIARAIAGIADSAWIDIDYTPGARAQVAECTYTTSGKHRIRPRQVRLIVRRTLLADGDQLFDDWRHHGFITDLAGDVVAIDAFHRNHATVELAIRDLKEGAGLNHCPSGHFYANAAWLACAVLAHNLLRWTTLLGGHREPTTGTVTRAERTRLINLPGRLVNLSGRPTLHLPRHWPWADTFTRALDTIRAVPAVPG